MEALLHIGVKIPSHFQHLGLQDVVIIFYVFYIFYIFSYSIFLFDVIFNSYVVLIFYIFLIIDVVLFF